MSIGSAKVTDATAAVVVGGRITGSAVMVAENLVLTCAHAVAVQSASGWKPTDTRVVLRFPGGEVEIPSSAVHLVGELDAAMLAMPDSHEWK